MIAKKGEVYIEKGSKFFGYYAKIQSAAEFKSFLQSVQKEHNKASHFCYAYIVNEKIAGEQIAMFDDRVYKEKYSNAGEPSGCGAAILNLLKYSKHPDSAIVVVRYFGGVLLGAGNLARAYAKAGKSALAAYLESNINY